MLIVVIIIFAIALIWGIFKAISINKNLKESKERIMNTKCPNCGMIKVNDICRCGYNFNIVPCPVCRNPIFKEARKCPRCGWEKEVFSSHSAIADFLYILFTIIALFLDWLGIPYSYIAFLVMLVLLAISSSRYHKYKSDPDYDESAAKTTFIAISVVFVLEFCLTFVIYFN